MLDQSGTNTNKNHITHNSTPTRTVVFPPRSTGRKTSISSNTHTPLDQLRHHHHRNSCSTNPNSNNHGQRQALRSAPMVGPPKSPQRILLEQVAARYYPTLTAANGCGYGSSRDSYYSYSNTRHDDFNRWNHGRAEISESGSQTEWEALVHFLEGPSQQLHHHQQQNQYGSHAAENKTMQEQECQVFKEELMMKSILDSSTSTVEHKKQRDTESSLLLQKETRKEADVNAGSFEQKSNRDILEAENHATAGDIYLLQCNDFTMQKNDNNNIDSHNTNNNSTNISRTKQMVSSSSEEIDRILERASDQLSLGQNQHALRSYRQAMKCAYSNVITVKQQLLMIQEDYQQYQHQPQMHLDQAHLFQKEVSQDKDLSSCPTISTATTTSNSTTTTTTIDSTSKPIELTQQQEREFELLLLQVASRVADIHNNMGVVHEMNRHFSQAQASYSHALDVYHKTCRRFEQKGDADVDRTYRNMERMDLACSTEEQRRTLHKKAHRLANSEVEEDEKINNSNNVESMMNNRTKLLTEAVLSLYQALELESQSLGATHPVVASTLIQLGKHHYEMRDFDLAVKEIRQAVTILKNALGPKHPQVGKAILLLASVYERKGLDISPMGKNKEEHELALYVDALEPLKATLSDIHPDVAFLYVKIGYLYEKKGDKSLAGLAYKAALKAYGESSSPEGLEKVNDSLDIISVWVHLTELLQELRCWEDVVVSGRRALYRLRCSKKTLFRDAQQLQQQPSASYVIADSSPSQSHSPPKTHKKLPFLMEPYNYFNTLFTILQCLGQAHTSLSQYIFAREACAESVELAWEIALSNTYNTTGIHDPSQTKNSCTHNNAITAATILPLVRALKRLGKVLLLQKHYNDSLQCFLPSLELLRSSKEMESTVEAASALGSLGFLYLKLERFEEASNFLKECLRLYQLNGVSHNDRETHKLLAWLNMAESKEVESASTPPLILEIPTIAFNGAEEIQHYSSTNNEEEEEEDNNNNYNTAKYFNNYDFNKNGSDFNIDHVEGNINDCDKYDKKDDSSFDALKKEGKITEDEDAPGQYEL